MPIKRGSQHRLVTIPEVSFGVTPATPVMKEVPITRLRKGKAMGSMRSGQLRQHPFVSNLMPGMNTQDVEIGTELQPGNHDAFLEALLGGTWTANVLKAADSLKSSVLESQHAPLYDLFNGWVITRGEFAFNANDDTPIAVTYAGMAIASDYDAAATVATSVTAATDVYPFVWADASVEVNDVATPISSITFRLERTVDAFRVLNSRTPREYVPGDVVLTGSFTVPYEDNVQSTALEAFEDAKIEILAESYNASKSFTFLIPRTKRINMNKPVEGRGALVMDFDFEAYYDPTTQTILQITRVP